MFKKIINIIFAGLLLSSLLGVTVGLYIFSRYSADLPDYDQLKTYSPPITTRLYAADGKLLKEFSKERRIFVPIEIIPKHLINAFLAAEDSNFYKHSGIDPFAIIRTATRNIIAKINNEPSTGGASTITQQVVKNFLLTNERTWTRKLKEAILAFRMTKSFSKQKILELYLNQIYLGSGAYGVAAAAQVYFNKSIDELSIEEVAVLATLPKAPSKLDPRKNIVKAKIRRDWVINRMLEEEFITEEEAKLATEQPIILENEDLGVVAKAEFFSDAVKKELSKLYGSDSVFESGIVVKTTLKPDMQKIADKALRNGLEKYDKKHGYRGAIGAIKIDKEGQWLEQLQDFAITDLYDPEWKKALILGYGKDLVNIGIEDGTTGIINLDNLIWARKYIDVDTLGPEIKKTSDVVKVGDVVLVKKIKDKKDKKGKDLSPTLYALEQIPEVNGSLVAMDPHTGRVLAMMGGYIDAPNQFNRATQAQRQPGSVLKTFGYLAAMENGLNPATIMMDEEITLDQGVDLPPYKPTNYSNRFYGPTTLRRGLEKSINVTTIRMVAQVGLEKIAEVISRFNINSNPKPIYSLVLGSTETSLEKLVTAYSMIVNGGKEITPSMIEKIQDRHGKVIFKRDTRSCEDCIIEATDSEFDNQDSTIIFPVLEGDRKQITDPETAYQITSILEGTVRHGTGYRARYIGKTIGGKTGTTNSSYDSWFVGFSPDLVVGVYVGFDIPRTLGEKETGASVALPIFVQFMKKALKDIPSTPFRVPDGIKFVKIDRTTGRYPTILTAKKDIMFEALKLSDSIEGGSGVINDYDENYTEPTKGKSKMKGVY